MIFALLILALCGIIGVGGGLYWALHRPQGSGSVSVTVHVGAGDTVTTVADQLHREGLIDNPLLFRLDARIQNLAAKLKAGDYFVKRDMSIDQMVAALSVYHPQDITVAFPEGWRIEQIAPRLQRHGIDQREFLGIARHPAAALIRSFPILRDKPPGASLEGYLFPDTYKVPKHYSARLFVDTMLRNLTKQFTPAMRQAAAREGLSVYQVLTLASIVEREARVPADRPRVAGVYVNRLDDKSQQWRLDADPTIQYVVGTSRNWWPVLTAPAATIDPSSPYNTYTHVGLPPGPIANPGRASITAVIHPDRAGGYFYFVAKSDCRHHAFARTYQEQLANQAKYHCGS